MKKLLLTEFYIITSNKQLLIASINLTEKWNTLTHNKTYLEGIIVIYNVKATFKNNKKLLNRELSLKTIILELHIKYCSHFNF